MRPDLSRKKWEKALQQNKKQFKICQDAEYLCGLVIDKQGNYNFVNCECDEETSATIKEMQEDSDIISWIHSHPSQVINREKYANCPIYPLHLSEMDMKFCEHMKNGWISLGVEDGIAIFDCKGKVLKTFED